MADSKRESREVGFKVSDGCVNEACYCDGSCREDKARDLTIKVTADVNDAITGFKALSRELREATKAARELEQAYEDMSIQLSESGRLSFVNTPNHSIYLDGKKVAKAVYEPIYATDFNLSTHRDLSEVPTEVLREELSRRKGVEYKDLKAGNTLKINEGNTSVQFGEEGFVIFGTNSGIKE